MFGLVALGILAGIWPFAPKQTTHRAYVLPTWRFTTVKDKFTGQIHCRVYQGPKSRPAVSYASRTVAFHFARKLDVSHAWYKLDGGAAKPWSADYPALTALNVSLDGDSLENPTGGLVLIPADEVRGVHTVTIRPTDKSRPVDFGLDGLQDAIANARSQGCDPDGVFIR